MVRQDSEAAKRFVERKLKVAICDPYIGLLVERDGKQVGAVILNDYTPGRNIEITVLSEGVWSLADVRNIARYCFARVRRITARTSVHNARAIKMLTTLGFQQEGILRAWFDDADAVVLGLLRSEQTIYRS